MGVSIQQYRAAIGLHQCRDNSNSSSSSSARSRIPNDYSPSSAQYEHIEKTYNVGGSWKLHACALLIIFLSLTLTSTCIPPTCQKLLLVQGGVETNPGPTLADDRKLKREYVLASLCENALKWRLRQKTSKRLR